MRNQTSSPTSFTTNTMVQATIITNLDYDNSSLTNLLLLPPSLVPYMSILHMQREWSASDSISHCSNLPMAPSHSQTLLPGPFRALTSSPLSASLPLSQPHRSPPVPPNCQAHPHLSAFALAVSSARHHLPWYPSGSLFNIVRNELKDSFNLSPFLNFKQINRPPPYSPYPVLFFSIALITTS